LHTYIENTIGWYAIANRFLTHYFGLPLFSQLFYFLIMRAIISFSFQRFRVFLYFVSSDTRLMFSFPLLFQLLNVSKDLSNFKLKHSSAIISFCAKNIHYRDWTGRRVVMQRVKRIYFTLTGNEAPIKLL